MFFQLFLVYFLHFLAPSQPYFTHLDVKIWPQDYRRSIRLEKYTLGAYGKHVIYPLQPYFMIQSLTIFRTIFGSIILVTPTILAYLCMVYACPTCGLCAWPHVYSCIRICVQMVTILRIISFALVGFQHDICSWWIVHFLTTLIFS